MKIRLVALVMVVTMGLAAAAVAGMVQRAVTPELTDVRLETSERALSKN